ncbi:Protein FAM98A [Acropora cervicornis]|uniref:Protein FAM98A n=1 Tax=Acropora cervicornis TaxID=6130 RepID=A0AAD9QV48_ACRCE|nr:Protein FAM98A [Acropora cervicornis]
MEGDIQDALEDLGFNGPVLEEGALAVMVQQQKLTPEFMVLCLKLVEQLKSLSNIQENVSEKEDEETFRMEMSGLLNEMNYLTSELQALQMIGGEKEEIEDEDLVLSPALQQLLSILTALNLPQPTKDTTVFELFSQIESKVRQLLSKVPRDHLGNPLLTKNLSGTQWEKVEEINSQLNQEYTLRRSMLLKRLDVSIQSFGWSDRAKTKKDEISSVFCPVRKSLSVRSPVSIPDVIATRSGKLIKTNDAEIRKKTRCKINRIVMGRVPDRGGRPSNVAPPIEMPAFTKRTEAPRDQRPSSGRGGRGGKVQGGWSSGSGVGEGRGGGGREKRGGQGGGWQGGRGWQGGGQRGNPFGGSYNSGSSFYYS